MPSITDLNSLFRTKENISFKKLENMKDIFRYLDTRTSFISIIKNYLKEIQENFKISNTDNITDYINFEILNEISHDFNYYLLNKKDIILFFKILIGYKSRIIENIFNIENFMILTKKNYLNKLNNKDYYYFNPINSKDFVLFEKIDLPNNDIIHRILNKHTYENINEVEISLDILNYGDIINLSLPSIGIIKNNYSINAKNYMTFISSIIHESDKNGKSIKKEIPLLSLNLGEKLTSILLTLSKNTSFNDIDNLNYNDNLKKLLTHMISKINIDFEEIYFNNKKIKNEYIIPFYYNKTTNEIERSTKNIIDKIKDIPSLLIWNKDLITKVLEDIDKNPDDIDKKNYKNIMACYLFYVIHIIYQVLFEYINDIDKILKNFVYTKDKRFKILNIQDAFSYTKLLKKSALKFKLILLNNFYDLFLPITTNIINGNYGMSLNEFNCYESDSLFINENKNIIDNYPFVFNGITIVNNKIPLLKFLCQIRSKQDLYNKLDLEFGGLAFDITTQQNSVKILKEYYSKLEKNNKFNLFIIEKIIQHFTNKKSIPLELIEDIIVKIRSYGISNVHITNNNKSKLERELLIIYETNIDKASKFYMKYIELGNKIAISKKINIQDLINQKDLYLIYYNIYYSIANCLYIISDKCISNIKFKHMIIKKMNEIKLIYEDKIQRNLEK